MALEKHGAAVPASDESSLLAKQDCHSIKVILRTGPKLGYITRLLTRQCERFTSYSFRRSWGCIFPDVVGLLRGGWIRTRPPVSLAGGSSIWRERFVGGHTDLQTGRALTMGIFETRYSEEPMSSNERQL